MPYYSSLILSIIVSVTGSTDSSPWTVSYSTDSGASWSTLVTGTGLADYNTYTIALDPSIELSTLQVKVDCPSSKIIRVYELFATGCYVDETSPSSSPSASPSPAPGGWDWVFIPPTTWTVTDSPAVIVPGDGFLAEGTEDGFYARDHTDGFFASDGTWTPVISVNVTWTSVGAPSVHIAVRGALTSTTVRGAATRIPVRGAVTDSPD